MELNSKNISLCNSAAIINAIRGFSQYYLLILRVSIIRMHEIEIRTVFYSLVVGLGLLAVLYYFKFRFIEDFLSEKGFFLFFAVQLCGLFPIAPNLLKPH